MKNFTKSLLFLIAPIIAIAQDTVPPSIQVSTTQYTTPELVNTILFNNSCFGTANNISFYSNNSIGYFQKNNTDFAFENGIILSTGYAMDAEGGATSNPNTGNWPGDADIDNLLSQWGSTFLSNNATILEFDFTPLTNHISFDYIFASNEYGFYQCNFGDAIAFLLTDTSTNSTTNMAIIPGSIPAIPISALTVRNSNYNSDCNSVYPEYFGNYYEEDEPKPINFTGATIPMIAESNVIPFTTYHLKIVIADTADSARDSAIFLKAGSFRIGNPDEAVMSSASGTVLCNNNGTELSINLDEDYNFQWKHNGNLISNATTNSVYVYEGGDYSVTVTKTNSDCAKDFNITLTQSVIPTISINDYIIIEEDNDGHETFDLSIVADMIAGELTDPLNYNINFYESYVAAEFDFDSLGTSYINTSSTQTIFVRIQGVNNSCFTTFSFNISVITPPSSPIGETNQNFIEGETVANLEVQGENIKWYATEDGTTTIPATTALTDTTTYYASQTINDIESTERLAITAHLIIPTLPPSGNSDQTYIEGETIANLEIEGENIKWYATENGTTTIPATTALMDATTYYASQTINDIESTERLAITAHLIIPTLPPSGNSDQTFTEGETLADIEVEGENIQWYDNSGEGNDFIFTPKNGELPLPLTTMLVDGTTYYATQTINDIESSSRLAVTVFLILREKDNQFTGVAYYPNPIKDIFTIINKNEIETVSIVNMLGQNILNKQVNHTTAQMDLSSLQSGVYLVRITSGGKNKTIKVIKE